MVTWRRALLATFALAATQAVHAQDEVSFDRPGIGFSTTVLDPGRIVWEQGLPGVTRDDASGIRQTRVAAGSLLRAGLGANLELQLGGSPWIRDRVRGNGSDATVEGAGDASIALKWQLPATHGGFEWALLASHAIDVGSRGLRADDRARAIGITAGWTLPNGRGLALYGAHSNSDEGSGWTLSPNLEVFAGETTSVYVEAGVGGGVDAGSVLGAGLTWQPQSGLQFDASFLRGLDADALDWQFGIGISFALR